MSVVTDYTITQDLEKSLKELLEMVYEKLPNQHKDTKLQLGARCELSYRQGQRDALLKALYVLQSKDEQIMGLYDEMAKQVNGEK